MRFKRCLALMVILALCMLGTGTVAEEATPTDIIIFLFDRCGGCGVDSPGCGECKDILKAHGVVKEQLGDRIYDGTLTLRLYNCRYKEYREMLAEYLATYAVEDEFLDMLPMTFIGSKEGGIYLPGQDGIESICEMLDRYLAGEDLQPEIIEPHATSSS